MYDRLGAELTLLYILKCKINIYLNEYKTSICKCTSVQAFLVFYIHKIRYSKNMNKETKLNKQKNISFVIP